MKIGIIVHSNTGNTLSVAQRLKEKFSAAGHTASIERITANNNDEPNYQKVQIAEKPDISKYDVLLLGAPVHGFSLSPVMRAYLSNISSLKGKMTACFMTQAFPYPWMGGTRSMKQMTELCQSKGASPYGTGIVNWANAAKREKLINDVAEKLCKLN